MLDQETLSELRQLNEARGLRLSEEELLDMAESLLGLVEAIYKPIKREWLAEIKEKNDASK